jgi:hypothetical protein
MSDLTKIIEYSNYKPTLIGRREEEERLKDEG